MLRFALNSLVFVLLAALLVACISPTADIIDAEAVTAAMKALAIGYTSPDTEKSVTSNITLPSAGEYGTSISWKSDNTDFISDAGVVTQPEFKETNEDVTLTATISKGSESSTKSFTLTVTRKNPTDEEAVESVKTSLSIIYAEGDSSDGVTSEFSLLGDGPYDTVISWDLDKSGPITINPTADNGYYTATVNRPSQDTSVTLRATIKKGGETLTKDFPITVLNERDGIEGTFSHTIPDSIVYGDGPTISLAPSHTVTGTSVEFALEAPVTGITVETDGKITVAKNLAVGTHSITVQASSADTDGTVDKVYEIVVAKKSISGASLTYTPGTLTLEEDASTGNTATPEAAVIEALLVSPDTLQDAVTFAIARSSGTTGTGTESSVDIDPDSGVITVNTAAEFTETKYTVTAAAKGNYDGSLTSTIKVTVELPQIGGDFDYTIPAITYGDGPTISLGSNTVTGTSVEFALASSVTGITVASGGTITVPANLAVGTYSITVQASSADTRGIIEKDYDIVVAKKSISGASLTYTPSTLTVEEDASTGNTATPEAAVIEALLVSPDTLQDAVTFTIAKSGTAGGGTESSVSIDDSGVITVETATAFTESEYTVTAAAKGNYDGSLTSTIKVTVELPQISGDFDYSIPAIAYGDGPTISLDSNTVTGTSVEFALASSVTGITVASGGTITVPANLAAGTYSITVQASSADTRGTIDNDYDIVVAKKSISGVSLTYTPSTLTVEKGASTGNPVNPDTTGIAALLVSPDTLQNAVTFSITKSSGTAGTGTESSVDIDPDSGIITVETTTVFTVTEYTVTAMGKGNYDGSLTSTIKVTVELPQISGDFDYSIPAIAYGDGPTISLDSNTVTGTSVEFALASSVTGITVASGGTITVPANLAVGTHSITVQASSADTRGTIDNDYDIVVAKKSISGVSLTYTLSTLTVEKGASTGNTVNPDTTGIAALLVSPDTLQNAVTFSITKSSGTAGTGTESSVDIDSDSGIITVETTTVFTETEYTVTAAAQGNYNGSVTSTIKVTVEIPQISGDFDYTIPASIAYGDGPAITLDSNTVTGTSVEFALASSVTGITVASGGTITVPANLAAGTHSITVQASSADTRGTIDNDYDIVVAKKSISGVSLTYTPSTLTVEKGASTGNTVNPDTTGIAALLVSPDTLQNAVTFSITKSSGTAGTGTESSVDIDSDSGIITVETTTVFTETEYTVTAAAQGNYNGSVTSTIKVTVEIPQISGDFGYSIPASIAYGDGPTISLDSNTVTGTSVEFALKAPVAGITVNTNGTITVAEDLAVGTHSITVQASSADTRGIIEKDYDIVVAKKSISGASLTYTPSALMVEKDVSTGNTATPDTAAWLVSTDTLQDAVTFAIAKTGATGGGTESSVDIDPVSGIITVDTATAFTATEYTVTATATAQGIYDGSATQTFMVEVVLDLEVSYGTGNKVKVLRGSAISPTAPTWNPGTPTGTTYTIAPSGSLPPGVAFDENSGEFTGTPDSSEALSIGTYTITAKVNNAVVDQDQVTLVVYARPDSKNALRTLMEEEVTRQGSEGDFQTVDTSQINGRELEYFFHPGTNAWAANFNGDISSWDVSRVTSLDSIFYKAEKFNQDIGNWDVSYVTDMYAVFFEARAFNQDISGWDVSRANNMSSMFKNADAFNQYIGGWDVSRVMSMNNMFFSALKFNQDIGGWNVSKVTNMNQMFQSAAEFNQDISGWDVSKVTTMNKMFQYAGDFNQNLDAWTPTALIHKGNMFTGSGMSTTPTWY